MRKTCIILAVLFAGFAVSCQKENIIDYPEPDGSEQAILQSSGKLLSAELVSSIPVTKAVDDAVTQCDEISGTLVGTMPEISSTELLNTNILGFKINLQVRTYKIVYNSVASNGSTIENAELTGYVSFLADEAGHISKRYLESVTMFHTAFNTSTSSTEDYHTIVAPIRSLYNALVVSPMYQGTFSDSGKHVIAPSETIFKAKQALDCEMAALELVSQLDDVEMMPQYYTENIGISNGGGAALAFQYLLDTQSEYQKKYGEAINLKSTYVDEGCCSTAEMFDDIINYHNYGDSFKIVDMNTLSVSGFITTVVGTFFTWKDKYFTDIDPLHNNVELKNYFSDEFWSNPGKYEFNVVYDYIADKGIQYGWDIEDVVNPDFVSYDAFTGRNYFNRRENGFKQLFEAMEKENDVIIRGWYPKESLVFAHSESDEFLYFDKQMAIYNDLSRFGTNRNVSFRTVKSLDHCSSTIYFLIKDILLEKHPNSIF